VVVRGRGLGIECVVGVARALGRRCGCCRCCTCFEKGRRHRWGWPFVLVSASPLQLVIVWTLVLRWALEIPLVPRSLLVHFPLFLTRCATLRTDAGGEECCTFMATMTHKYRHAELLCELFLLHRHGVQGSQSGRDVLAVHSPT